MGQDIREFKHVGWQRDHGSKSKCLVIMNESKDYAEALHGGFLLLECVLQSYTEISLVAA